MTAPATPFRVVIVGGGPAGLATALALANAQKQNPSSSRIHITLLERRESVQRLGGAVNLTPLALRYLDALHAGQRLRAACSPVSAIELVGNRLGNLIVQLWPGVDAVRVQRLTLVECLLATLQEQADPALLDVQYGARITSMQDGDDGVSVQWTTANKDKHEAVADMLIGCDGIHSQVRSQLVDPDRKKSYDGRSNAYGYVHATPDEAATWKRTDGKPLITDTTLLQNGVDSLLMTYYQPPAERDSLYVAAVMPTPEPDGGSREGWTMAGANKDGLKKDIEDKFRNGPLACVPEILQRCQEWYLFPIYMLAPGGIWSKGRVQLLGDAAHAMPPQGESTGVAIEDGVLMAHILSRRDSRSVPQMLSDFEALRRADIDKLYVSTMRRSSPPAAPKSWLGKVAYDWLVWAVCTYTNWTSDHFARDVRKFALPE